jgi:hypothetical protein
MWPIQLAFRLLISFLDELVYLAQNHQSQRKS